jgi:hypothetical protein
MNDLHFHALDLNLLRASVAPTGKCDRPAGESRRAGMLNRTFRTGAQPPGLGPTPGIV